MTADPPQMPREPWAAAVMPLAAIKQSEAPTKSLQ